MPIRFHLFKSENIREQCPYCGRDLKDKSGWKSDFHSELHYKKIVCKCGKENFVKVDFHGSGHDDWCSSPSSDEESDGESERCSLEHLANAELEIEEDDFADDPDNQG